MKTFLCHSSKDSEFVIEVAKHLKRNLDEVFYYEEYQRSDRTFLETINHELEACEVMVIFVGSDFSEKKYPVNEANTADTLSQDERQKSFFIILLSGQTRAPAEINLLRTYPTIPVKGDNLIMEAYRIAKKIVTDSGSPVVISRRFTAQSIISSHMRRTSLIILSGKKVLGKRPFWKTKTTGLNG